MASEDPNVSKFTDVIDILPWTGDGRGTTFDCEQKLVKVTPSDENATVYYTTEDPAKINEDPGHASNGAAGKPSDMWSTEFTEDATAIRVVSGELAYGRSHSIDIDLEQSDTVPGDVLVNKAVGRAESTKLRMRTSANMVLAQAPSLAWKKVEATDGSALGGTEWELTPVTGDGGEPRDGAEPVTITDCDADDATDCEDADKDPKAGSFLIAEDLETTDEDLADAGWYRLVETKAPEGFELDSTPRYVHVNGETVITDPIENKPTDDDTESPTPTPTPSEPAETPSNPTSTPPTEPSNKPTVTPSDQPSETPNKPGLASTGAAGIFAMIGAVALLILIGWFALHLVRQRRHG